MSATAQISDEHALTAIQSRVQESIAHIQARAQGHYRDLARYLSRRPIRSIVIAFMVGVATARLLEKLD